MTSPRAKQVLIEKLGTFVQQYRRKAQHGVEKNDRKYDLKLEQIMKRLPREELSQLLSEEISPLPPLSEKELEALLAEELQRCTPAQRKGFEAHRVPIHKVPIHRLGITEEVFVVAEFSEGVLYYEDVEEGFEVAALGPDGAISEQGCNQFELSHVLSQLGL